MKVILKRVVVSLLVLLFLVIIAGSTLIFTRRESIQNMLIKELNKELATTVRVGDIRLGFIQHFPNVTARFSQVLITPAKEFTSPSSQTMHADTLLYVRDLHILLNPIKLLKKNIALKRLTLRNGRIYLAKNISGSPNYKIFNRSADSTKNGFNLAVGQIQMKDIILVYRDDVSKLLVKGVVSDLHMNFKNDDHSFQSKGDLWLESIDKHNAPLVRDHVLVFNTTMINEKDTIWINDGQIDISGFKLTASGHVAALKPHKFHLSLSAKNKRLNTFIQFLPQNILNKLDGYRTDGDISVEGTLDGILGPGSAPMLNTRFNIDGGTFRDDRSGVMFKDVSISGNAVLAMRRQSPENQIQVDTFQARFNQEIISGSFAMRDFSNPEMHLAVTGNLDLAALNQLVRLPKIELLSGMVRSNIRLSGRLKALKNISLKDLELFEPVGHLELQDVQFKTMESSIEYASINGSVMLGNHFWLDGISLYINDNQVFITGELRNMLPYLNGRREPVLLKATVRSPHFDLSRLIPENKNASSEPTDKTIIRFPEHILANIQVEADRFQFRKFNSEQFSGIFLYEPGTLYLDSLSFRSMKGLVQGHGVAQRKTSELFDMQVYADLQDIDITELFFSFNNFGQKFIVDDNLKGQLTGDVYFYSDWSSGLKVQKNSIIADAHLHIENGELLGFEPIQSLSKYLAVKELENIQFSTLENEIFINEQVVTIPVMDIASSAFTITASGTHHFDNQFEYNLKVLLSDILATKARRTRRENSEFGIIEDDGLGRTSLYFKVSGMPGNVDVTYDENAMLQSVKNQLKNEGQSLRKILSEEFGRDNQDTVARNPENKKFLIRWDEADSSHIDTIRKTNNKKFNISWEEETAVDTSKSKKK